MDAIDNLLSHAGKVKEVQGLLRKVPDLERLLRKIHACGIKPPAAHPESRAVLYETEVYGKKKILDLVNALDGEYKKTGRGARILRLIVSTCNG